MAETGDDTDSAQALRGSELALLLLGAGQHAVSHKPTSSESHLMGRVTCY